MLYDAPIAEPYVETGMASESSRMDVDGVFINDVCKQMH